MPDYRIYFLDRNGRIAGPPEIISCEDDEQAKKTARQYLDRKDIELWAGARMVDKITRQ